MRISEKWLREWVSPRLDSRALAERLTMAGLEVSALEPAAPAFDHVIVGEVVDVTPHPNADRLRCCKVRIGSRRILNVVCGAPDVATGQRAPVALAGARLPNGSIVQRGEIRGATSEGMLCSAAELGLAETSEGLLLLDADAPVGKSLRDHLALDDTVFEIDLTPNRGDCLSVAGLAREVAALTGAAIRPPAMRRVRPSSRRRIKISLKAPADGARYVGRMIEDIDAQARTPLWMQERLRRGGIRSIHPVVDVTNYVMLEMGQPMHAFDCDRLRGGISVRHARAGERIALLDGSERALEGGTLVIADGQGPLAIAGIMGGSASAVTGATRHILLESAFFRPGAIAGRARTLGLSTESSHRFERGVDPTLQRRAAERATELIVGICGGRPGPMLEQAASRHLPRPPTIRLRRSRITHVLGTSIPDTVVGRSLRGLGMRLARAGSGWRVVPPSFRFDLDREEDLIEGVARMHGYDRKPAHLPVVAMQSETAGEATLPEARLRTALIDRDYQEVITYSFVDPAVQTMVDPTAQAVALVNPIASDQSVMRTSLWPGLLQALRYNVNRQQARVRLFETGRRFRMASSGIEQPGGLGGLVFGTAHAEQWGVDARPVDFYDVKGDVEALLAMTGRSEDFRFEAATHPVFHPGRSARLFDGKQAIGWIGVLHPQLQARLDLPAPVTLFEIDLEPILRTKVSKFSEISRFPAVRCDISLTVSADTPAQKILDHIREVAGNLLVNLELFDEYRGEGIDSGRKSLALALTLQDSSRTLKETEVEAIRNRVVATLERRLGAQLRS